MWSRLHEAAANGNVPKTLELLREGHDVDAVDPLGLTPLYYAAASSHLAVVETLINHGAASTKDIDSMTRDRNRMAVEDDVVTQRERGANVDQIDNLNLTDTSQFVLREQLSAVSPREGDGSDKLNVEDSTAAGKPSRMEDTLHISALETPRAGGGGMSRMPVSGPPTQPQQQQLDANAPNATLDWDEKDKRKIIQHSIRERMAERRVRQENSELYFANDQTAPQEAEEDKKSPNTTLSPQAAERRKQDPNVVAQKNLIAELLEENRLLRAQYERLEADAGHVVAGVRSIENERDKAVAESERWKQTLARATKSATSAYETQLHHVQNNQSKLVKLYKKKQEDTKDLSEVLQLAGGTPEEFRRYLNSWMIDPSELFVHEYGSNPVRVESLEVGHHYGWYKGLSVRLHVMSLPTSLSQDWRNLFQRNMRQAVSLWHPSLIPIIGAIENTNHPIVVSEVVEVTSLETILNTRAMNHLEILKVALELSRTLWYLHHSKPACVMAVIEPANVYLQMFGDNILKTKIHYDVADVLERSLPNSSPVRGVDIMYIAPELLEADKNEEQVVVTAESDMYCFGILLFQMFTREFPSVNPQNLISQVESLVPRYDMQRVIMRCIDENPNTRINAKEVSELLADAYHSSRKFSKLEETSQLYLQHKADEVLQSVQRHGLSMEGDEPFLSSVSKPTSPSWLSSAPTPKPTSTARPRTSTTDQNNTTAQKSPPRQSRTVAKQRTYMSNNQENSYTDFPSHAFTQSAKGRGKSPTPLTSQRPNTTRVLSPPAVVDIPPRVISHAGDVTLIAHELNTQQPVVRTASDAHRVAGSGIIAANSQKPKREFRLSSPQPTDTWRLKGFDDSNLR